MNDNPEATQDAAHPRSPDRPAAPPTRRCVCAYDAQELLRDTCLGGGAEAAARGAGLPFWRRLLGLRLG